MIIPLTITIPSPGLDLGYTVLDLDRAVFASFSTAGMVEVGNGVYAVAGGVVVPDGGGYVQVWTELDGDADEFIGEAAIAGVTAPSDPWAATLPGGYAGQEAGAILGRLAELDTTAVTQVSSSLAGHLTITRGLTFAEAVTGLTIPVDWEAAYWTLKRNPVQPDTAALVRLLVTNPAGESDGLQRLKGAEPASPITEADGTLTVTQATGRIDIWLSDELTANLNAATSLGWDVKFIDSAGDSTGRRGTADVVLTETHATA